MSPRAPIGPRVDTLEDEVERLKKTTAQLERDQRATRRLAERVEKNVKALGERVDAILPSVKTELAAQTEEIEDHVSKSSDELKLFVMGAVRQTPAWALVLLTFLLTVVATVVANWVLAAEHLPHIH